jgi:hypothetical protein
MSRVASALQKVVLLSLDCGVKLDDDGRQAGFSCADPVGKVYRAEMHI